ncbi:TetR/AcrR family transcriptional regulator [Agromyces indicus]|uniref:TetR/AcrR family transcriptional regulator n=1 Tax=Agromyces indicus TaxID=758919 RepID=A0ABU1FGD3_9MICO|nr:TetR/AcrR family transcriptional regulator [Agromyces indicus]MDR5690824.1 TetR/AcrR family transcriptional regulator [Agromyces indicus]
MRPGPRRSLTHPEILDAAFELLETKGFDAVSVRGVAGALGLTPTAMYTYYPNKQALLAGMVEQVLGRLHGVDPTTTDAADAGAPAPALEPRDRVQALASALRDLLVERPGAVGLLLATPLDGPNAARMDEDLLTAFTDAGLDLASAGRAAHAVRVHVLGAVAFDAADAVREADAAREAEVAPDPAAGSASAAASDTLWDDLESFPLSGRSRDLDDDPAGRFAWGLDRLLDGLLAGSGPAAR